MNKPKHYYIYACAVPFDSTSLNFWTRIRGFVSHHSDIHAALRRCDYLNKNNKHDGIGYVVTSKYYPSSKFVANQMEMEFE